VGIAEAGAEATAALAALTPPPEVVITAPRTPELPVHELLPALRRACPTALLLVVAEAAMEDDLTALAASGIDRYAGYLLWDDLSTETLRQCLGAVAGGDVLTVSRAVAQEFLHTPPSAARPGLGALALDLTPQERAVLDCLADGRSASEITRALDISLRTLRRITAALHAKLDAPSLFTLGARAAALGLLHEEDRTARTAGS